VLTVAVAMASSGPATAGAQPPAAHASGGEAIVLTYPSLVKARVTATRRALKRAAVCLEDGRPAQGAAALRLARRQMAAAWRGARYVMRTTPPPVADEARVPSHAHASGGGPTGPTRAAPADTALLVLTLHHAVAASTIQLVDGATGSSLAALVTTLDSALAQRDTAIQDIRTLAPPSPLAEEDRVRGKALAHASGGEPTVSSFATLMPDVVTHVDDEVQEIDGILSESPDLSATGRRGLRAAITRLSRTRATVNALWPPIPVED
jgi:hypothetical protein